MFNRIHIFKRLVFHKIYNLRSLLKGRHGLLSRWDISPRQSPSNSRPSTRIVHLCVRHVIRITAAKFVFHRHRARIVRSSSLSSLHLNRIIERPIRPISWYFRPTLASCQPITIPRPRLKGPRRLHGYYPRQALDITFERWARPDARGVDAGWSWLAVK